MNRVEALREYIDEILLNMSDTKERRTAYVHLYGVAQACAMIALKRGEDVELATMAGMLHDIYTYTYMDAKEHAHKGSILARDILTKLNLINDEEKDLICGAIYNHSDKHNMHSSFDEVLIDADVLQHCLYNPTREVMNYEVVRYYNLKKEFGLNG
jgi:HD superfamily phosphodiesterase